MAGATLSSTVLHSHSAFGSIEKIRLDSMVAMDTGDVDGGVGASTSSENRSITNQNVKTLPPNSRTVFSAGEVVKCNHCNYTSNSTSEMTQHRWEVHPLLARRKQHLMKQSDTTRKRQNSESLERNRSMDGATPSKKTLLVEDIPHERMGKPERNDCRSNVKRSCSAGVVVEDVKRTTNHPPKQRKSFSLGDLSSLKQCCGTDEVSQPSFVASSATAPPVTESVARKIFPSDNSSVKPEVTSSIEATSSRSADVANPSFTPDTASARGGLYTLARAALSAESAFVAATSSTSGMADNSNVNVTAALASQKPLPSPLVYATWTSNYNAIANKAFVSGDKLSYGYVSSNSDGIDAKKEGVRLNPFSFVPCVPGGIVPHGLATILPLNGVNGGMYYNPAQIQVPCLNPGVLSPHFFSGLPVNILSSVSDVTNHRADVTKNAASSCNSKLTTLSHVATSLLNNQPNLIGRRSSSSAVPERKLQPSSVKSLKETPIKEDSSRKATASTAMTKTSPNPLQATALVSNNDSSFTATFSTDAHAIVDAKQTKSSSRSSLSLPCFPQVAAGRNKLERASSSCEQRSPVGAQAMDEDRVKSLEAALRNTDCCDPNERSSILPFRCSDGKWQMVRTKRIGGAWLVQAPGREGPSVYLPNKEKHSGEALNDWLKAKLNSFTGSSIDAKVENNKSVNKVPRTIDSGFNKISAATINNAQNDVIRNLLLQKTAIA